jgi:stage V sporulation protein B
MQKNKQTTTKNVLKGAFYNFLTAAISKIGALIFTILVARMLFPELFGIYSLALTVVLTIATFTDLGLNATATRYLAESLTRPNQRSKIESRSRLAYLFNFKIILTGVIAAALFLLSDVIANSIFHKALLALPLKIGAIYLFVISLQGFLTAIFYALQKINYNAVAETISQVLRIALVILFFQIYKGVGPIFVSIAIALFISFVFLGSVLLKRYRSLIKGPRIKLGRPERKRLLGFFGWLTVSSISLIFFTHIDIFMLGIFLPAEFAAYYNTINTLVWAVAAFVAFGSMLLPIFTQLEKGKLERGFKKVFHYTALIAIPAAIGLAFIAVPAIQLIYGQAYVPVAYKSAMIITSVLLSLVILESALSAIYSAIFQAKEKPKIPSILIIIATIANIILNYVFLKIGIAIAPQYGLVAVAAATLITRYGNMFALAVLTKRGFKMKIDAGSIIKPLIASVIMLGFLFAFDYFVHLNAWTGILMVILAMIVYLGVMWLIKGINKEDIKMLRLLKEK